MVVGGGGKGAEKEDKSTVQHTMVEGYSGLVTVQKS
jgi:hypothetical protein